MSPKSIPEWTRSSSSLQFLGKSCWEKAQHTADQGWQHHHSLTHCNICDYRAGLLLSFSHKIHKHTNNDADDLYNMDGLLYVLVGYTTSDLVFMWQSDPVQMDEIALPQFDIKQEDIKYGNCTKYYQGTG